MPDTFAPHLATLLRAQRELWPHLAPLARHGLVLHGGTAVALRLGYHDSLDFDYFTDCKLDRRALLEAFPRFAAAEIIQDEPDSWTGIVPGPAGGVRVSFFGTLQFGRISEPDMTQDGVAWVASLQDLLAQKLKTVMQRVEPKDYRDIAAILRSGLPLDSGMAGAMALYGVQFSPAECAKALVYFNDRSLATITTSDRDILLGAVRSLGRSLHPATLRSASLAATTPAARQFEIT